MNAEKAYIIRNEDNPLSVEYAQTAADSCDALDIPWEYHEGFYDMDPNDAWNSIGLIRTIKRNNWVPQAQLCTASHAAVWMKIRDNKECAIILEHDAIMLHDVRHLGISDNRIITLGYKLRDKDAYDHESAGPPKNLRAITGHEGAHAYIINHKTAETMINEIEQYGVRSAVDNMYFLLGRERYTQTKLAIADPTPAIGWIRQSTIWPEASEKNYPMLQEFKNHLINK